MQKQLLVIDHCPSTNTRLMLESVLRGARHEDISNVITRHVKPLEATENDVLNCDAIILGTTENLGYMSGALKDFFDRIYNPCLEQTQGKPCAAYIRAGHDGTGTRRAIETIVTGLRWSWTQDVVVCTGPWQDSFLSQCEELGMAIAATLDLAN